MNKPENLFKFKIRVDDIGLIPEHPNRYHSTVTVISDAANGAFDKVLTVLGKPKVGRDWQITVQDVDEVIGLVEKSSQNVTEDTPSRPVTQEGVES